MFSNACLNGVITCCILFLLMKSYHSKERQHCKSAVHIYFVCFCFCSLSTKLYIYLRHKEAVLSLQDHELRLCLLLFVYLCSCFHCLIIMYYTGSQKSGNPYSIPYFSKLVIESINVIYHISRDLFTALCKQGQFRSFMELTIYSTLKP